jgi:tetratricopeptide (TPR) repeat protein
MVQIHLFHDNIVTILDYFDIGLVFTNKDDYTSAKEFYAKSRLLFEQLNLKNELSDCYFNIGEICLFEKKYQEALDNYMQGLRNAQGQFDAQYQWSPGLGWAQ